MDQIDKPVIEQYPNGIILPRKEIKDGPLWGLGGVLDEKNQFVSSSFYDGGWAKHGGYYEHEDPEYMDVPVVYIGMFFLHWGHFLADLTNRLWALPELCEEIKDIKVAYLGEEIPAGNNLRFFELLGVKEEQLIHITKPIRFKTVYVPQQAFKSCDWYTDEFIRMLDYMVDQVMEREDEFADLSQLDKVYFTRRKFGKAKASEFGEEYFEKCFNDAGYVSVAPESLNLDQQIYIWNHAGHIACINGTIPINVLFTKNKNLDLTILNKTSIPHENPLILLEMRGVKAEFVNIFKEPLKGYPKSLGEGPFLLWPTEEFDNYLKNRALQDGYGQKERVKYFKKVQMQYYWAILNFKTKFRRLLSRSIPSSVKRTVRKVMNRG